MKTFIAYRPDAAKFGKHNEIQLNDSGEPQFQGVIFDDGTCVVRWMTGRKSTVVWNSFEEMLDIHGHPEYGTYFEWSEEHK